MKYDNGDGPDVAPFLAEIEGVCRRWGLSIGHEDDHGAFQIRAYEEGHGLDGHVYDNRPEARARRKAAREAQYEASRQCRNELADRAQAIRDRANNPNLQPED